MLSERAAAMCLSDQAPSGVVGPHSSLTEAGRYRCSHVQSCDLRPPVLLSSGIICSGGQGEASVVFSVDGGSSSSGHPPPPSVSVLLELTVPVQMAPSWASQLAFSVLKPYRRLGSTMRSENDIENPLKQWLVLLSSPLSSRPVLCPLVLSLPSHPPLVLLSSCHLQPRPPPPCPLVLVLSTMRWLGPSVLCPLSFVLSKELFLDG